ncbi:prepilin-type N-terminal cleavage/methylation domain-containing protein [Vibrio taketomensis]|uniref:type IV pilus modification PilV family protein n=1 Tax=Vibrio taketomensis TaxID=2572923 RepID=UPI0013899D27|nr:prepilin-type N-terminal cleavage/methylation domain-containing protein [Vibrio taketomensis]
MISKIRGFSLVEVMVTFLLIGVAASALIKLQAYVEVKSDYAKTSLQAMLLAESKLEKFRQRGMDYVTHVYTLTDVHDECNAMSKVTATTTIQLSCESTLSVSDTLSAIEITAYWLDRQKQEQSVVLKTMLSSHSEFDS